ncbi:Tim44 domain-containing protein [Roseibium suaedae]|uniref:Predicted lipid-binding transport protein, Tim44 family n=1 Tax=Roseibium suaedae TaxID=735517 RepID=A0A1M7H718_9HYPH|nr:TIM44-like domain-containing protein [Roseibium suaedae]SHM24119.1 Predicted lipid-binding transport protein, Tim44 family [Roseibium suaedae]
MPAAARSLRKTTAVFILGLATLFAAADFAEARRAGSSGFGSRGMKTFSAPAPTKTTPGQAAPIQRTMTPQQTTKPAAGTPAAGAAQQSRGLFGGFGGALMGGLLMGGLLGMMFGGGFGGAAGFLGMIVQMLVIGLIVSLALRYFRSRQQPQAAGHANQASGSANPFQQAPSAGTQQNNIFGFGGGNSQAAASQQQTPAEMPISVEPADLDRFEEMLAEVQDAYSREDYAALRKLATPEAMSFLAEELGELASTGKRNTVTDVKLLEGDVSEAWSEGQEDYATVAMRYSAVDAVVDRANGQLLSGSLTEPQESTELWTFKRVNGGEWVLAAIQGTE